jgi:hypothetical protein
MDENHTDEQVNGHDAEPKTAEEPVRQRKRRRQRPNGRYTNPATPLQAARFERRLSGREVITEIRRICRGHGAEPCRIVGWPGGVSPPGSHRIPA